MALARRITSFAAVGLIVTLAVAGLASVAPAAFGWLTLPFWVLPAMASLGAHDVEWPLFLLSGTIFYGALAFGLFQLKKLRSSRAVRTDSER